MRPDPLTLALTASSTAMAAAATAAGGTRTAPALWHLATLCGAGAIALTICQRIDQSTEQVVRLEIRQLAAIKQGDLN